MPRNQHKALKAKFDKFSVGYGPIVSSILGTLRAELFGPEDHVQYLSPIQGWDEYVNGWRDLPHDKKMALLKNTLNHFNISFDQAFKRPLNARKRAIVARSQKKGVQLSLKRKKA